MTSKEYSRTSQRSVWIMKKIEGFTLIEIMVSMVISSLVIAGVYGVYTIQQRSYTVQEQVSEMQQRIRAAVDFMSRDMRMAGYNPPDPYDPNNACENAAITQAGVQNFTFSYCDVEEVVPNTTPRSYTATLVTSRYGLYDAYNDNGGVPDALGLIRNNASNPMPVAEGVEAIEFLYRNENGAILPEPVDLSQIRAVQISVLVRSTYRDMKHTDSVQYIPLSNDSTWGGTFANPPNDNYHRRLLKTTIYLRNMGVQQ